MPIILCQQISIDKRPSMANIPRPRRQNYDINGASLPVVMPQDIPLPTAADQCLMFMRSAAIQIFKPNDKDVKLSSLALDSFTYSGSATCGNNITIFDLSFGGTAIANNEFSVSELAFRLTYKTQYGGYWSLISIDNVNAKITSIDSKFLTQSITVTDSTAAHGKWSVTSVRGYSFACGISDPAWMNLTETVAGPGVQVGIVLIGHQVQPFHARNRRFTRNVDDCVGTFSVGSWMGIIVALVLITALLLSWMMLNSVQTMDRFDDPKQKQIVINVKE